MQRYKYEIRRWSQTAKECYMRGCICTGKVLGGVDGQLPMTFTPCPIYELYFKNKKNKCQVKTAVIETVRKFGIPKDVKRNDIIED